MTSESSGISRSATPAWIDHAIWWQVYPLGATGAPIRPEPGTPLTYLILEHIYTGIFLIHTGNYRNI